MISDMPTAQHIREDDRQIIRAIREELGDHPLMNDPQRPSINWGRTGSHYLVHVREPLKVTPVQGVATVPLRYDGRWKDAAITALRATLDDLVQQRAIRADHRQEMIEAGEMDRHGNMLMEPDGYIIPPQRIIIGQHNLRNMQRYAISAQMLHDEVNRPHEEGRHATTIQNIQAAYEIGEHGGYAMIDIYEGQYDHGGTVDIKGRLYIRLRNMPQSIIDAMTSSEWIGRPISEMIEMQHLPSTCTLIKGRTKFRPLSLTRDIPETPDLELETQCRYVTLEKLLGHQAEDEPDLC